MSLLQIISADNFITVNRTLIKKLGLEAAVMLGELASEYSYWSEREELREGFFFSTVENIEEKTGMTAYQQRQAINKLAEMGIVEVKKMGIPAKRYIRISEQQVMQMFNDKSLKNLTTGDEKTSQQDVKKFNTNKTKDKKTEEKDKSKKERKTQYDQILDSVDVIASSSDLRDAFVEFIKMRKMGRKPLTDRGLKLIINKTYELGNGKAEQMKKILEQSIERGWQGVFEIKTDQTKQQAYVNPFTELKRQEGLL